MKKLPPEERRPDWPEYEPVYGVLQPVKNRDTGMLTRTYPRSLTVWCETMKASECYVYPFEVKKIEGFDASNSNVDLLVANQWNLIDDNKMYRTAVS
jgi:hypothetical protein